MKKKLNIIAAIGLAVCMAFPVAMPVKAATVTVTEQKVNDMISDAQNYANYLEQIAVNKKETRRIKKEIVDNYTKLSAVNPDFLKLIPAAQLDYNNADADYKNMKKIAKKAKDFVNSGTYIRTYATLLQNRYRCYDDIGWFVMTAIDVPTIY